MSGQEKKEINLKIDLQPIQAKLFKEYENGRATKIGFGGSRGGAKSHTADMLMLYRRLKYEGTNGLFVMRIYQDMLDIHIIPLFEQYPELRKFFNQQNMILKLPNNSYIRFLSGDGIETLQQRKGRGFADIVIDQSEMFSEEEIMFLYTLNRTSKIGLVPKTLLCFNPSNIGHSYHKRVFIDRDFNQDEDPDDYFFIKAVAWDNAYWSLNEMIKEKKIDAKTIDEDKIKELVKEYHRYSEKRRFNLFIKTDYGRTLNQLPEHRRRAELFGDMDIFEGMFFEDFRREHHVIEYEIIPNRVTIGGLDYGNKTSLTILQADKEGTIVACREIYIEETNPTDRANRIADFLLDLKLYNLQIIYDTDMDISQISNVGFDKTPIEIFRDVLSKRMGDRMPVFTVVNKYSLDKNKPYRQAVNDAVKDYIKIRKMCINCRHIQEDKKAKKCEKCGKEEFINKSKLYIDKRCSRLIKFFTEAIYDQRQVNDFLRGSGLKKDDHSYDSFKYPFMWISKTFENEEEKIPKWVKEMRRQRKQKFGFMGV